MKKIKTNIYIYLHLLLLLYSFCGVFSKLATQNELMSLKFCLFYGTSLMILVIYAIFWQQILKNLSLTTAFFNKSITIIWGMIWGILFFSEKITLNMILGTIIVLIGIGLVVTCHE